MREAEIREIQSYNVVDEYPSPYGWGGKLAHCNMASVLTSKGWMDQWTHPFKKCRFRQTYAHKSELLHVIITCYLYSVILLNIILETVYCRNTEVKFNHEFSNEFNMNGIRYLLSPKG